MNHVNFKNESVFFLKSFWTNGFSIWTVTITLTGIFSDVQLVCEFREALWFNQLMWIFFVPIIYQISFRFFLIPKTTRQFKTNSSKFKIIIVSVALSVIMSSVIIEYVYFAAETLLIIPEHYKDARGSNYDAVPWLKALNWGFIIVFLIGERYRKYLVEHGEISQIQNENLNTGIQISLITLGFVLSLSTFVILHTLMNIPSSDFCKS